MVLLDSSNPSWDKKVSSYILSNACIPRNDDNDYDPQEEEEDFPIDCSEQFELGVSSIGRDQRSRRIEDTGSFVTWSRMRYVLRVKQEFINVELSQLPCVLDAAFKRIFLSLKRHLSRH